MTRLQKIVGAMTIAAASLTASAALADEPAGTPLATRPSTPLAPAPTQTSGTGWKLFLMSGAIAGAAWWYQKKHPRKSESAPPQIKITARSRIGLRAELLVVEVQGQSLLLGVGPQGVQSLAVLDSPADARLAEPAPESKVPARLDALLRSANRQIDDVREEDDEPSDHRPPVGGQAEGLHKWIGDPPKAGSVSVRVR